MRRKHLFSTLILVLLLASLLPAAAAAQGPRPPTGEPIQLDDGTWALPRSISTVRGPDVPGSITTFFASNNQFAGNMFDFTVIGPNDVTITSFDVNIANAGATAVIQVYYRLDSYVGHEGDPTGWVSMGTDTVVSQGTDNPTAANIGGVTVPAGATYGLYVLVDYPSAPMRYTNGDNVFSNADVQLTLGVGKGTPPFTGSTFNSRTWNGTIYYDVGGGVVANPDTAVSYGWHIFVDVLANDTGLPPLLVQSVTQPANGTAVNYRSRVLYIPDRGFKGTDTFEYTVVDANGGTAIGIVEVMVY